MAALILDKKLDWLYLPKPKFCTNEVLPPCAERDPLLRHNFYCCSFGIVVAIKTLDSAIKKNICPVTLAYHVSGIAELLEGSKLVVNAWESSQRKGKL